MKSLKTLCQLLLLSLFFSCSKKILLSPSKVETNQIKEISTLVSNMQIPVSISAAYLNKELAVFFTDTLYHDDSFENNDNDGLVATVTLKKTPVISASNNQLIVQIPLHVVGEFQNFILQQKFDCDVNLQLASTAEITSEWKIKTKTILKDIRVQNAPEIKLGFFTIDSEGLLIRMAKNFSKDLLTQFDREVYNSPILKEEMARIFDQLHQPIQLNDTSFLKLEIQEVFGNSLTTNKNDFYIKFGFTGNVFLEDAKNTTPHRALIPFQKKEFHEQDYTIHVIQDHNLNSWKADYLKEFQHKTYRESKNKSFTIDSISILTTSNKMFFTHYISGKVSGEIQTSTLLEYDSLNNSFSFTNNSFTTSSQKEIDQKANWISVSTFLQDNTDYLTHSSIKHLHYPHLDIDRIIEKELQDPHVKIENNTKTSKKYSHTLIGNQIYLLETAKGEFRIHIK